MAKTDLEEMVLRMSADINRFEKSMQKAIGVGNQTAGRIEKRFKDMNRGLSGSFDLIGNSIKGAFTVAIVDRFAVAMRGAIKSVADIGDAADKLGLTTDEFQRIQFAAQLAGVEAETFANGLKKLALNSSEAARGGGELGKIFEANGVKITDANGRLLTQVEILGRVADLVRNAANEQDKAAIAQAAFGKSGVDLLNLLEQGAGGVNRAMAEANRAGVTLTDEQIRKAQEFDDQLEILEQQISVALKGSFIDYAENSIREFNAIIAAAKELGTVLENVMGLQAGAVQNAEAIRTARENILKQGTRFGPTAQAAARAPAPAPTAADGKGSLPANIDAATTQLRKETVLPPARPAPRGRTTLAPREKGPNGFESAVSATREDIALMNAQLAAMTKNTFALNGYNQAVRQATVAEGLLNDAKSAGLKITPQLKVTIDQLAGSYAGVETALENTRVQHDDFVASLEEMKSVSSDVMSGFVKDLLAGKSATDALVDGLGKLADKLIEIAVQKLVEFAFNALLNGVTGGAGGGAFAFAKGGVMTARGPLPLHTYASGGIANSPQMAVFGEGRSPEAFVPLPDGRTIPVTMKGGGSAGATLMQNISISGTGDAQLMENLKKVIAVSNRELVAKLPGLDVQRQLRAG